MEIVKWAIQYDVEVSSGILNKFVILLASYGNITSVLKKGRPTKIGNFEF